MIFASQAHKFCSIASDELFISGNYGLARAQSAADPTAGRFQSADELDNNIHVRGNDFVNVLRPANSAGQPVNLLALNVAIANVS